MQRILCSALLLHLTFLGICQYKVDGFIIHFNKDTIHGTVSLDISKGSVNYASLDKKVKFIDSLGTVQTFGPDKIQGFGLRDDAIQRNYETVILAEKGKPSYFLKKLVNGKITLYEKLEVITPPPSMVMGQNGNMTMMKSRSTTVTVYYLKNGDSLTKIEMNRETYSIKKKELKQIISFLPESFINSDEEIDLSKLVSLLEKYNSTDNG